MPRPEQRRCTETLADGRACKLPAVDVPDRFRLDGAERPVRRCWLHRADNRVSRLLLALASRRVAILQGTEGCPCGNQPAPSACLLGVTEAAELAMRYLDALDTLELAVHALSEQLIADLIVRRMIVSRIESHLVQQGIIEEIVVTGGESERVTTGRASSLLRSMKELARSIGQDEQRLLAMHAGAPTPGRADDSWLMVTDDRTGE